MTYAAPSTIAQLLFQSTPTRTFPALVQELDSALARCGGERQLSWDNDDMVFVDMQGTRVGLGFAEHPTAEHAACLTVSVGPATHDRPSASLERMEGLCRRIATRASDSLGANAILWREVDEPVTADLVDRLLDELPFPEVPSRSQTAFATGPQPAAPASQDPGQAKTADLSTADLVDRLMGHIPSSFANAAQRVAAKASLRPETATEAPDQVNARPTPSARTGESARSTPFDTANPAPLPPRRKPRSDEIHLLRKAILGEEAKPRQTETRAQRLTAHAMNVTLTLAMPPVGAAMLASSYRNGTNLAASARAMAMTGAFFGFARSATAADLAGYLPF